MNLEVHHSPPSDRQFDSGLMLGRTYLTRASIYHARQGQNMICTTTDMTCTKMAHHKASLSTYTKPLFIFVWLSLDFRVLHGGCFRGLRLAVQHTHVVPLECRSHLSHVGPRSFFKCFITNISDRCLSTTLEASIQTELEITCVTSYHTPIHHGCVCFCSFTKISNDKTP